MITLQDIEQALRNSPNEWQWLAAQTIQEIPEGHLARYGTIAHHTNSKYGLSIIALNVAWLRKHLYYLTNRETDIPIHRLATQGDTRCRNDSERTRKESRQLRKTEGSWENPKWWNPDDGDN